MVQVVQREFLAVTVVLRFDYAIVALETIIGHGLEWRRALEPAAHGRVLDSNLPEIVQGGIKGQFYLGSSLHSVPL